MNHQYNRNVARTYAETNVCSMCKARRDYKRVFVFDTVLITGTSMHVRTLCDACAEPLYWLPTAEQWGAP